MKRLLIMFITMVMAVGAVAAAEAKQPRRTERTVQGSYGPYPAPVTGCNEPLGTWACMIVPTRHTERFFSVKVTDTHGLPVAFYVHGIGGFCGQTKGPVLINGHYGGGRDLEIEVGVDRNVVQTDCPQSSVKTTGTIKVTLSNHR